MLIFEATIVTKALDNASKHLHGVGQGVTFIFCHDKPHNPPKSC